MDADLPDEEEFPFFRMYEETHRLDRQRKCINWILTILFIVLLAGCLVAIYFSFKLFR